MTDSGHAIPLAVFVTANGHGGGHCSPLSASGMGCAAGEPGMRCGRVWGRLLSPSLPFSEVWLQCLLSGGECCFLISACSYLERSWFRVAVVVSVSGAWVWLCPAAFNGDSTAWVLLRWLWLASAPPCRFRARFAGQRSRLGVLALDQVVHCSSTSGAELEFWHPGVLCWSPIHSTLRQLENLLVFLDFSRLWLWFSSSHCWSLIHWRHLSAIRPTSAGDRYLSGLLAGDGGLPLRRRIHERLWLVACLPLLREWRTAPSQYP